MCVFGTPSECLPPGYAQRTAVAPPNAAHGRGVARRCAAWPGVVVEAAVSGPRARLPGRLVVARGHTDGPQPSGDLCAGPVNPPRHALHSPTRRPAGQLQRPLLLGGRAGRRDRAHDLVRRAGWSRPLGHGLGGLRSASAGVRAPLPSFIQTHVEGGGGRRGGVRGGSGCARGAQRYQMTSGGGDRPRAGELSSWASGWAQQAAVARDADPSKSAASG